MAKTVTLSKRELDTLRGLLEQSAELNNIGGYIPKGQNKKVTNKELTDLYWKLEP